MLHASGSGVKHYCNAVDDNDDDGDNDYKKYLMSFKSKVLSNFAGIVYCPVFLTVITVVKDSESVKDMINVHIL